MKHKTSELEGALLDAAVAKAEGMIGAWVTDPDTDLTRNYRPSSDWRDGGPIIERERIKVEPHRADDPEGWDLESATEDWYAEHPCDCAFGPTPLIAAMRAYVTSKLGYEVEL